MLFFWSEYSQYSSQLGFLFIIANKQNKGPAVHLKKLHKEEFYDFTS
jgi:hypothetical protein